VSEYPALAEAPTSANLDNFPGHRRFKLMKWFAGLVAVVALAPAVEAATNAELKEQVRQSEIAFAKTMADRDHAAFVSFLSEETLFFGRQVYRGRAAVAASWKRFYEGPQAPFSWRPETAEVLDSGTLALSSGPVFDPQGQQTGTFTSIWRLEKDDKWRVLFDKGCDYCPPPEPEKK
jgi:ketosteroid isomerase-like protein